MLLGIIETEKYTKPLDIASNERPLSESVIKQIHSLVLIDRPEDRGFFRRIPVRIMGAYTEPVQPYLIEPKITELLFENEKRKATMNPIERIARFHLEFEGVHPFIDGNGYPPINVKFTERKKYYDAFDEYYRTGKADKMTELVAGYVNERLDDYMRILCDEKNHERNN